MSNFLEAPTEVARLRGMQRLSPLG